MRKKESSLGRNYGYKDIILTKKESKKITKNLRKGLGKKAVPKKIEKIMFHKDFKKGERIYLCLNCGYPALFWGVPMQMCNCKKPKIKVYELNQLSIEKFITDMQILKEEKNGKN